MKIKIFCFLIILNSVASAQTKFENLESLLEFAQNKSATFQSNGIKLTQAKKAKIAALLSVPEVTGNLLTASLTDNLKLPVNLFPAEVFGGPPGGYKEIKTGIQYNTMLNNFVEIKILNPQGIENLKLSNSNIELVVSNNKINIKSLYENIATNYFSIAALQQQIKIMLENVGSADTIFFITSKKYKEGQVKQQEVNDANINLLNTQETANQLKFLLKNYYLSLKILCDIPENEEIIIIPYPLENIGGHESPVLNHLAYHNSMVKEKIARSNYKFSAYSFWPTLSFQFSNTNQVFNKDFRVFDGNWYNSNYIGLKLNIPIPSSAVIAKNYNALYDYRLAQVEAGHQKKLVENNQLQLINDFEKAYSQYQTNREIFLLRKDSFMKNKNLYAEGLIGLEVTLNSLNAMINAHYNLITSASNVWLANAKISINNKIN